MDRSLRDHDQELIILAQARIDKPMIKIVQWLNQRKSIITTACCQGHDEQCPWVMFIPITSTARNKLLRLAGCDPKEAGSVIDMRGYQLEAWEGDLAIVQREVGHFVYHMSFLGMEAIDQLMERGGRIGAMDKMNLKDEEQSEPNPG